MSRQETPTQLSELPISGLARLSIEALGQTQLKIERSRRGDLVAKAIARFKFIDALRRLPPVQAFLESSQMPIAITSQVTHGMPLVTGGLHAFHGGMRLEGLVFNERGCYRPKPTPVYPLYLRENYRNGDGSSAPDVHQLAKMSRSDIVNKFRKTIRSKGRQYI